MATKRKDVHLKASKNAPKKKKFDENANYLYVFDVRGTNIRKNNQAVRIPNNATTIEELREGISHVFPNIPKNQFKIILFGGKKNDNFEYHMHQPQHRNELVEKLICPRHRGWLICCDAAWRQSQYNDHHERSHKAEEKAEIKTTEDVKKIKDSMVIFVSTEPEEENEKIGEELAVKNDNTRMDYSSVENLVKPDNKILKPKGPYVVDVRDEKSVDKCVDAAVAEFGGIDILINNASAISVTDTLSTEMKRYDLMHQINLRGSFLMAKKCIPYLKKAENPHILTMGPPLNMDPKWFGSHVAYTISKYGMSMLSLGLSEELKPLGIASNTLWPRTVIWTSAIKMLAGAAVGEKHSRKPQIVADAAYAILGRDAKKVTGKFFIDDEVLASEGIKNLDSYAYDPTAELGPDFFVEMPPNLKALKVNADIAVSTKAIPKPAADPPKNAGGLSNVVQSFASSIKPEHVAKVGAVIQFAVKTKDGVEEFAFDLKESGKLIPEKAAEPCVTLMMDENCSILC